jgi:hypothetical protein
VAGGMLGACPRSRFTLAPISLVALRFFAGRSERRGWLSAVTAPVASRYWRRSAAPRGIVLIGATPRRRIEAPHAALCDMPRFNDQKQWHDRAAEMRALAERMSDINTKRIMLRLAEDYDKFSDPAAERAGGRRAWVSPSIRLIRPPSGNLLSAIARRPKPSRSAENMDE